MNIDILRRKHNNFQNQVQFPNENKNKNNQEKYEEYQKHLKELIDYSVYRIPIPIKYQHLNPHFSVLQKWLTGYFGPATMELYKKIGAENTLSPIDEDSVAFLASMDLPDSFSAIHDENRNAIIPELSIIFEDRKYFVSIKGCGAYEDMFSGNPLKKEDIMKACRDPKLYTIISQMSTFQGLIMSENWMGESPYGAQGEDNGFDELNFSKLANPFSIQGAYICPLIGLVQIPDIIEKTARKLFWFRSYSKHFYQSIRLVPSRIRLYFESTEVLDNPEKIFNLIGLTTSNEIIQFEMNFISSGIALLTLYTRSATIQDGIVKGLIYQDVWLDKDAILALDGIIHFADLEGLIYKSVPLSEYSNLQKAEWHKLVFEFIYALHNLDKARRKHENLSLDFTIQRQDLSNLIQSALESDRITNTIFHDNSLFIKIEGNNLPTIEIPFLEGIYN